MKKITFLFTFLITSLSFGQNLVSNGGFESGDLTSWGGYSTAVETSHGVMTPHSGAFFATRGQWSAVITNNFTVEPETEYTVKFWFAHDSESYAPGKFRIGNWTGGSKVGFLDLAPILADDGSNAANAINYGGSFAPINEWREGSFTFTTPAGMTEARFQWWSDNAAIAYLDDVEITVSTTAGLEDLTQFGFSYYPNPAKDNLSFNSSKEIQNIAIFNILGQKMLSINKPGKSVNVSNLVKGIYIIKTTIQGKTGSFKFIKE